jgi:rhodanese-related sulfurtransferase
MRKVFSFAAVCILGATVASAQMKVQPKGGTTTPGQKKPLLNVPKTEAQSFPRMSIDDAFKLYRNNQAVFIDVRSNEQFTYGHIKNGLSIPGSQLIKRFREVPSQKTIITYCACSAEQSSGRAAADLIAHGVKNVFALKGGWTEWKAKGHPTAVGPK